MSNQSDNRPAQTLNEQSSNLPTANSQELNANTQEPLKLLQETQLCGATLSVYGTPIEPLFLAKEVADAIDHSNSRMMLEGVDEDEKLMSVILTSGQRREMWFLTEQGLYEVLMQSRKPIAKDFKRGVKKLLKGIRTGEYHLSNTFIRHTNRLLQSAEDRIQSLRKAIKESDKELLYLKERTSLTAPIEEESFLGLEPIRYRGGLWYRLREVMDKAGMAKSTPDYIRSYPADHLLYCGNHFITKRLGQMIYHRYQINRKLEELASSNPLGLETDDDKDAERSATL